jgi:hypothetical protein
MDGSVALLALDLCLIALVWFLRAKAERTPDRFWVYLLYGLQLGPRSDVKYMTKSELYESGTRFIVWGLIASSALLATGIVARALGASPDNSNLLLALWFGLTLLAGMCFLGGGYLLLRGSLRSQSYSPPQPRSAAE